MMAHAPFPAGRWWHAPFPPVGRIIGARTVPSRWRDQQCGGNSASRWRRCCGCSASRWRLSASHWRRGRWRLPPRQQWRKGTAVDNPVHWHANRTVQCPMFLAEEFGRCTFQPQFLKPFVKLYQQRMASASRWQRRRSGLRIVDSGLGLSYQQGFCSRLLHPARCGRPWDRGP